MKVGATLTRGAGGDGPACGLAVAVGLTKGPIIPLFCRVCAPGPTSPHVTTYHLVTDIALHPWHRLRPPCPLD
jgi:hypothetical protein